MERAVPYWVCNLPNEQHKPGANWTGNSAQQTWNPSMPGPDLAGYGPSAKPST